jgi:hypothetical protein
VVTIIPSDDQTEAVRAFSQTAVSD